MVLQQARLLAFGLRLPPCRCPSVSGASTTAAVFTTGRYCTAEATLAPTATSTATGPLAGSRSSSASSASDSSSRRRQRTWWGMTLSSDSLGGAWAAHKEPPLPLLQQRQRGLFLPAIGRLMSTHRPDGMGGTSEEEEEEEEEDDLLSSLAEELVWKGSDEEEEDEDGDDDDDEEEYDKEELEGVDLESLGISMMDDESAEEVQEQLRREWGTVSVSNEQSDYQVDTSVLQGKLRQAMEVLGCQSWDVGAVLTTDKEVARLNRQYRGMTTSTDILSFPNNDLSGAPGVLPKVRFPAEMDLGDMFISLAYVDRQIKRDIEEEKAAAAAHHAAAGVQGRADEQEEQEWWDSERGVSGAMSRVYDVQERASMLLVHGLIHLLGYDHETEEDYEAMVAVEEEVLRAVFAYQMSK